MKTIVATSSLQCQTITDRATAISAVLNLNSIQIATPKLPNTKGVLRTFKTNLTIRSKVVTLRTRTTVVLKKMQMRICTASQRRMFSKNLKSPPKRQRGKDLMHRRRSPWTAIRRKENRKSYYRCMKMRVVMIRMPRGTLESA
jgi:superfamily I DNA and RNA helicase